MKYRYYIWTAQFSTLRPVLWRKKVEKRQNSAYDRSVDGETWEHSSFGLTHKDLAEGSTKRISRYEAEKLFPKLFKRKRVHYYINKDVYIRPGILRRKQEPFSTPGCDRFEKGWKRWKKNPILWTDAELKNMLRRISMRLARHYFPEAF